MIDVVRYDSNSHTQTLSLISTQQQTTGQGRHRQETLAARRNTLGQYPRFVGQDCRHRATHEALHLRAVLCSITNEKAQNDGNGQ